jgi:transcriptional regulator with XRE-family HTH domain
MPIMDRRAGRGQNPERAADARLGRAIRAVRRERGLTLAQVAGAAELSQPFLSQLELGRTRPSMRSLFRIAGALGTTQQALLAAANDEGVDLAVATDTGRARLLMHDPDRADVTEFVGAPGEFHDFFRHDRHELLYVVRGAIEVEVREQGSSTLTTLEARGMINYPGAVEHRFRQVGPVTCVVLLVHSGASDAG